MRHTLYLVAFLLTTHFIALHAMAQDQSTENKARTVECSPSNNAKYQVASISINTNPIFDESAANTITLHRWANRLHTVTKPFVVREKLSFDEGEYVSLDDIVEAEAILRNQSIFAEAKIQYEINCATNEINIHVDTFDNWSLIPTFSYSRSGGENSTIVGLSDSNLFGLGIRAAFRFNEDEQRSGYRLAFSSPVRWIRHGTIGVTLEDNDDGEAYGFFINKPFYHLGSKNAYFLDAFTSQRDEDIFQNNATRNTLAIDTQRFNAGYGWQLGGDESKTRRLIVGFTHQKSTFAIAESSPSKDMRFTPQDRDFTYAWFEYEYIERDIIVLRDIYFINQSEDINLGWQLSARVGIEADNRADGLGTHSFVTVKKGLVLDKNLFLFRASTETHTNVDINDVLRFHLRGEYFYRKSSLIGYYARVTSTLTKNQFLELPITVDEDTGVRGFPTQFQHGDHRVTASAELRFFTGWNFYQLFDAGFAAFIEAGRAYGGEFAELNEDPDILSSAGFGARLYSNKANQPGVIHIDIAFPQSSSESVDSWQWSLQFRRNFE